jgi:branched-chain amino acid transport system substrate-binding protein
MINAQGGINGRRLNFISVDDGYSPPKTVEQSRRLVEQEQVALLFNSLGTPTNAAIQHYCNDNKVPQLFVSTGASMFSDPEHFPWTIGFNPSYWTEARIYAKHILSTKRDAKIGVLYQNDDFGKDYLIGLKDVLGPNRAGMVIKEVSYEMSEPTVDSQIVTLQVLAPTCSCLPRRRKPPPRRSARRMTSAGLRCAISAIPPPRSPPSSSRRASRNRRV